MLPAQNTSGAGNQTATDEKKRGSLSRVKSTPKEEGGGDILNLGASNRQHLGSFRSNCALTAATWQALFSHCIIFDLSNYLQN
jgi:hypothetical protein